tara:strand:- start:2991 stop:3233 length:243 start_codon:yes stop_codon:yes gene_type:complete
MKVVKTTTQKVQYLGKRCKLTTIYFTKSKEGKRLVVRNFEDNLNDDIKLVEGFAGPYENKIPFKIFDDKEAHSLYQQLLK